MIMYNCIDYGAYGSLPGRIGQEIATLHTATAQRVPLPDPRVQVTQLLPKKTTHDDAENYAEMFEAIVTQYPE